MYKYPSKGLDTATTFCHSQSPFVAIHIACSDNIHKLLRITSKKVIKVQGLIKFRAAEFREGYQILRLSFNKSEPVQILKMARDQEVNCL